LGETGSPVEVRLTIPVQALKAEVPVTLGARLLHVERRQEGGGPGV